MSARRRTVLVFAAMCLIWGSTFVAVKTGLEGTPPLLGVALRQLLASLVILGVLWRMGFSLPTDGLALKQYFTVGLMNFSFSYSLTYLGTQFIYSNISSLLWSSVPITTALAAHLFLPKERMTISKAVGIAVGFGGVSIIFLGYGGTGENPNLLLGMSLVFGAVLFGTWPPIYLKMHGSQSTPLVLTFAGTGIGGVATLILSLVFEDVGSMVISPLNIGLIVYLALFGTALAWVAYFYLLDYVEAVKVSFVGFIAPIIATFMGIIVLGEQLSPVVYLGALLVLVGIYITDARRFTRIILQRA
ncbi:MAG: DMT family transporter [Candidatus Marinimicrobia bacterium]|nr:DMT family transporter [Candidatus Neomarinimicrobiota bacterium]